MLLLYLLLYQAKELRNAVPEGHVAGLGGYVNYRGNTVIVVVMVMAGYPRYIRRRRSCRLGFLAGSGAHEGLGGVVYGHYVCTAGREKLSKFTVSRSRTAAAGSKFREPFVRIALSLYKGICIVRVIKASLIVIRSVTSPNGYRERCTIACERLIASDYCIDLKHT